MKTSEVFNTLEKLAIANEEYPSARLAAALVKSGRIVSIGINRKKTDPLQARFAKNSEAIYLHAEIHALKNALREMSIDDVKNCNLFICRMKKYSHKSRDYHWGMARPCSGCMRAIAEFGIKNVYYTTDNHEKYEII